MEMLDESETWTIPHYCQSKNDGEGMNDVYHLNWEDVNYRESMNDNGEPENIYSYVCPRCPGEMIIPEDSIPEALKAKIKDNNGYGPVFQP